MGRRRNLVVPLESYRTMAKRQWCFQDASGQPSSCSDMEATLLSSDNDAAMGSREESSVLSGPAAAGSVGKIFLSERQRFFDADLAQSSQCHDMETPPHGSDDEDLHQLISGGYRGTIFGQTSYQRSHEGVIVDYDDADDDAYVCSHCNAFFWSLEALEKKE